MKSKMWILILCISSWLSVGCSNQWRDADAGVSAEEMLAMLEEVQGTQGQSINGGSLSQALALKDDPATRIYFAESSGIKSPLGPVASVLSLTNFEFLGAPDLWWGAIEEARIFFMDLPTESGRQNSLIIGVRKFGETSLSYAGFTGIGSLSEEELVVTLLANGADKVVLRSFDVEEDDLANVIQLLVWDIDGAGMEYYNGKFSTLVGYGD